MRAIVTGGAGFIGSHVVDALLARGDEVWVLDNLASGRREHVDERAALIVGDVRSEEDIARVFDAAKPHACLHFAAQADVRVSIARPDYDCEVNVLGTVRVLEACRRHRARLVFASTGGAIYGECHGPAAEDAARRPLSPYAASKLAAEEYLETYARLHGGSYVSLRLGNVYGPRQDPHGEAGVVAIFLGVLATGGTPRIFGDGTQTRDYVYVGDVVEAALTALEHPGGVFNVGTGRETSVLELFEACRRIAGSSAVAEHAPPRPGELSRSVLDPTRAKRELGFAARTSLAEGLEATWEWIRRQERP